MNDNCKYICTWKMIVNKQIIDKVTIVINEYWRENNQEECTKNLKEELCEIEIFLWFSIITHQFSEIRFEFINYCFQP